MDADVSKAAPACPSGRTTCFKPAGYNGLQGHVQGKEPKTSAEVPVPHQNNKKPRKSGVFRRLSEKDQTEA